MKNSQDYSSAKTPDLSKLRNALFWDTDINKIDWLKQYRAVIMRIFERGNVSEKQEIINFYGADLISEVTGKAATTDIQLPVMPHLKRK